MGSTITIVYLRSIERIHLRGRECFLRIDTLLTQVGVLVFLFSKNSLSSLCDKDCFASCKWTFHDLLKFICDTIFCYVKRDTNGT